MSKTNPGRTIGGERIVAERLAAMRKEKGWTLDALASKMKAAGAPIQPTALHKLENGYRRVVLDEAIALSNVFGVSLEDLVTPLGLIREKRARALASELVTAAQTLDDAYAGFLEVAVKLAHLGREFPEQVERVADLWTVEARDAGQWFGPFVGKVPEANLTYLADLANDFWDGVIAVVRGREGAEQ